MLGQSSPDLTQLDPESPDLYLGVHPSQELDRAIRQIANAVAGLVQPAALALTKRIGDKKLSGEIRPIQITPRQPTTTDIQLTGHTDRHRLQPRVKHVEPSTMDAATDVHAL